MISLRSFCFLGILSLLTTDLVVADNESSRDGDNQEDRKLNKTGNSTLFNVDPITTIPVEDPTDSAVPGKTDQFIISASTYDHSRGRKLEQMTINMAIQTVQEQVKQMGGQVKSTIPTFGIVVVEFGTPSISSIWVQTTLMSIDSVEKVEIDQLRSVEGYRLPNGGKKHGLQVDVEEEQDPNVEQVVPWGISRIFQNQLPHKMYFPPEITHPICVMDTGFYAHEDMSSVQTTSADGLKTNDCHGHGTHVSGTIVAENNGFGVLGVFPGAPIIVSKVFGKDDDFCGWGYPQEVYASELIHAAVDCYEQGAKIVTMSLGGSYSTYAEQKAFEFMTSSWDMLFVAAAGNSGPDAIGYPASYPDVISVAASDINNDIAFFSSTNPYVDIAAPGDEIISTVPPTNVESYDVTIGGQKFYHFKYMQNSMEFALDASLTFSGACHCEEDNCADKGCANKLCLIPRGSVTMAKKGLNCLAYGGAAAVIYNNMDGIFNGTIGAVEVGIPMLDTSKENGEFLIPYTGSDTVWTLLPQYSKYEEWSGTSMACPHVSGAAFLLWNRYSECDNEHIRDALLKTTLDLGPIGKDNASGNGLLQYWAAQSYLDEIGCDPQPSASPLPSMSPSISAAPSFAPSESTKPSVGPSSSPSVSTEPSSTPSLSPSTSPSANPTVSASPSDLPSSIPSSFPTTNPSASVAPSSSPSDKPSFAPTTSAMPTDVKPEIIWLSRIRHESSINSNHVRYRVGLNLPVPGIPMIARVTKDEEVLTYFTVITDQNGVDTFDVKVVSGSMYKAEFEVNPVHNNGAIFYEKLESVEDPGFKAP